MRVPFFQIITPGQVTGRVNSGAQSRTNIPLRQKYFHAINNTQGSKPYLSVDIYRIAT